MAKLITQKPLYQALDFAMVRAPLLPVEAFHSDDGVLKDPRVLRAVAVGSVSLLNALHRREQSGLSRKDEDKLMAKLLRYRIRMSTRPTPYGLFAGCAFVPVGERTDISIVNTFGCSRTRPDMAWLMNFVVEAEADPAIRRTLRLTTNCLIYEEGGRASLAARLPGRKDEKPQPVSIRATRVVRSALELAKSGISYGELAEKLLNLSSSATPEKVERLIDELVAQTFLFTDLRPPLTTDSPVQYVMDRLPEDEKLKAFLRAACQWDRTSHQQSIAEFPALLRAVDCPEDGSKELPCQVDMALAVNGQVGSLIAKEAARAAELLLRLSPFPNGLSSIAACRNAFLSKYGNDREVPLPELLDQAKGLGPVSAHGHAYTGPDHARAETRGRTLLALACSALNGRQRVVNLEESIVAKLETSQLVPENLPVSLDINLMIAAKSGAAIDQGEFIAVVGPNLGAWAACRNFGRFAHLYPRENGIALLHRAAEKEEAGHFQDQLWAEVVYLPSNVRSANVTVRPAIRSHEIVFGMAPGVPDANVLVLDDLMVGVDNGRFYVRSRKEGKRIRFVSGHMLNHHNAPAAAQFLLEVGHDGVVTFNSFDWGQAEAFPFLPRVQVGRIVLRPAEWKISKEQNIGEWREEWNVPRYVCLSFGDNRLVIDLDCDEHRQQILAEQAKLGHGQTLLLQEVLPALDDLWLQGEEGHYYGEFIVPLVLRQVEKAPKRHEESIAETGVAVSDLERLRPPGSDWLFAKLYCQARSEDDLIAERLQPMAKNAVASGLADSWFFIRYADPEPHIRLRFHGKPDRLSSHLFRQVSQWARQMMDDQICSRIVFDTYDREIERFGGLEGMIAAEQVFHADSEASATLIKVLQTKHWEDADRRTALLALSADDLLRAGGFDEGERMEWYKTYATDNGKEGGIEYRRLKSILRSAIGSRANWLAEMPFGTTINAALVRRAEGLPRIEGATGKLCQSFLHLHLNRVGAASTERMLLALLFRVRASLMNAPFKA